MKLAQAVKPISYVKANASEIIRKISEDGQPIVITQNGEAKAVFMDVREYDQIQQSLAMVKMLSHSSKSLDEGRVSPMEEVFENLLRARRSRESGSGPQS